MKPTGIYVAAVTPRVPGAVAIDVPAALDLVQWFSARGVSGLLLMGSTGEFPHYTIDQRIDYMRDVIKTAKIPVLVNASHSCYDGAIQLANAARDAGAAGVVLMPPYYFRYSQEQLFDYFRQFGDDFADFPLYLYNIPFFTTPLDADTACRLLDTGRFAGIKDSSGKPEYLDQILPYKSDKTAVFVGNDVVFTKMRMRGADGVVSGVSCGLPELMVGLDNAITSGNAAKAEKLEAHLQAYIARIDAMPAPIGVKETVKARGLRAEEHSIPFGPGMQKQIADFHAWLRDWMPAMIEDTKA